MSFLHVWHHATVTLVAEYGDYYILYPTITFVLIMNSFVHIIMYGYYGLTALYPLCKLSWKQRITQLQMVQFLLGLTHSVYGYLCCGFCMYYILYSVILMALFENFYFHAFASQEKIKFQQHNMKND